MTIMVIHFDSHSGKHTKNDGIINHLHGKTHYRLTIFDSYVKLPWEDHGKNTDG